MNKLLTVIISIIVLILAIEGGYLWGVKNEPKQISCPIPASTPTNQPSSTKQDEKQNSEQKIGTTISAFLPFVNEEVAQWMNSIPKNVLYKSTWEIVLTGTYISKDDASITIKGFDGIKRIELPYRSTKIEFSKFLEAEKKSVQASADEFLASDKVSITIRFNTLDGTAESVVLSKFIPKN